MKSLNDNEVKEYLISNDPVLRNILNNFSTIQPTEILSDFIILTRIIIGQQLSVPAAKTIFSRLTETVSENYQPNDILELSNEQIARIGLSAAKSKYIKLISEFIIMNPLFFQNLKLENSEKQIEILLNFKGVGIWTASIFLMNNNKYSNIFPFGDVTLNRVIKLIYKLEDDNFELKLNNIISKWDPYKSFVCRALWNWNDNHLIKG